MELEQINLKVVIILTIGFALASLLGYISQRLKLSPILGYLLAGYVIGPYVPGYTADMQLAEQLAEVGVILMMFGVGLHFKWQDLVKVKSIAIPGAVGQTLVAAAVAAFFIHRMGGSWASGVMIGLAIGVASTVVLVRVLSDNKLLNTNDGHITVGWLIVEDVLTVMVLILLPTLVALLTGASITFHEIAASVAVLVLKFFILAALMFTLGRKFVSYTLFHIARTRSNELFTLTLLALIFLIATGSALLFGTSIALGAFIAGMVIGQTEVHHQASAYASPMKDAFVVIFFLSVGMLFNPVAIIEHYPLFLTVLTIVLVVKPLTAFVIVWLFRYPLMTALTVAIALAQIGEFSFILAEEAAKFHVFPDEGFDVIVACSLISISINPILFKLLNLVRFTNIKRKIAVQALPREETLYPTALVIGYGGIGQAVVRMLDHMRVHAIIMDRNVDIISKLAEEKREAVYGEASLPNILETVKVESVKLLIITIQDIKATLNIVHYARKLNPTIKILARARYFQDEQALKNANVQYICSEEKETANVFQRLILALAPSLK